MSEFTLFSLPPVILSFGRAGSIQLALWFNKYFPNLINPSLPVNHIEHSAEFPIRFTGVIQTHSLIKPRILRNHTKIFALRKDPVETILSLLIAQHYDRYHITPENENDALASFTYKHWAEIDGCCRGYIKWHRYYSKQIDQWSFVVVFETMLEQIDRKLQQPVYPNKGRYMLNVDQVREYITETHLESMLESTRPFLHYTNPGNIYAEFTPERLLNKSLSSF